MKRRQLGFLLGRVLAVYTALRFVSVLMAAPSSLMMASHEPGLSSSSVLAGVGVSLFVLAAMTVFLWFGAGALSGGRREGDEVVVEEFGVPFRATVFAGIGLVFLINSGVNLIAYFYGLIRDPLLGMHSFAVARFPVEDVLFALVGIWLYFVSFYGSHTRTGRRLLGLTAGSPVNPRLIEGAQ